MKCQYQHYLLNHHAWSKSAWLSLSIYIPSPKHVARSCNIIRALCNTWRYYNFIVYRHTEQCDNRKVHDKETSFSSLPPTPPGMFPVITCAHICTRWPLPDMLQTVLLAIGREHFALLWLLSIYYTPLQCSDAGAYFIVWFLESTTV